MARMERRQWQGKEYGAMSSFYKQQLHPSHFPHSWEVGGPSGGRGVSVFNNYRQFIRPPFCIIDGFLFLNRAKSGCTVTRHLFTQPSDNASGCLVTSHINVSRCLFFKITDKIWWRTDVSGDCTDHRALYARGLVDQSASLETWRLHRPPSTIRSGTGRPVCQCGELRTVPITKRYMLGDWSISLYDGKRA